MTKWAWVSVVTTDRSVGLPVCRCWWKLFPRPPGKVETSKKFKDPRNPKKMKRKQLAGPLDGFSKEQGMAGFHDTQYVPPACHKKWICFVFSTQTPILSYLSMK